MLVQLLIAVVAYQATTEVEEELEGNFNVTFTNDSGGEMELVFAGDEIDPAKWVFMVRSLGLSRRSHTAALVIPFSPTPHTLTSMSLNHAPARTHHPSRAHTSRSRAVPSGRLKSTPLSGASQDPRTRTIRRAALW